MKPDPTIFLSALQRGADSIRELVGSRALAIGIVALMALLPPVPGSSMTFSVHSNSSETLKAVLASGEILPGDTDRLMDYLSALPERPRTAVYLSSPGGSLSEGMRIGRFFNARTIRTVVEGGKMCASACALALLGGSDGLGMPWRSGSTSSRLGFHSFSTGNGTLQHEGETQRIVAEVLAYADDVEAPMALMSLMFGTASHSMHWLSDAETCSLGIKLWSNSQRQFLC